MTFSVKDSQFMSRALRLADKGRYTTRPNPRVGCVLAINDELVSEGWHYRAGEPHAEVHALSAAEAQGRPVQGATAYVTLEPCSHQGRTGACARALIDARVARVVYGMKDPNPLVSGRGLTLLSEAGILVDGPFMEGQAQKINRGFNLRMQQQRPWVTCKMASSLDGRTAMASGESQWITGSAARQDVQDLRAQSCAVVTGIGSILQDNSRLSLRADELALENVQDVLALPPLKVILDSTLRTPEDAAIFSETGKVVIFTSGDASQEKETQLLARWGDKLTIERVRTSQQGLDIALVLQVLAKKYECNQVLLEAGATLSGCFLQAGLIDEWVLYQAPILMGSNARPLFDLPVESMDEKINLTISDMRMVGDDMRITLTK